MNFREIRISILYFVNVAIMILAVMLIRKCNLLSGSVKDIGIEGMIAIIIVVFITFAMIPCMIASVWHMVKAARYDKVYYKEKHYAEWHYSRNEWRKFIVCNFKKNNIVEMKSFRKAAVYYSVVVLSAFLLDFLINSKDRSHVAAYLLIAFACFGLCFLQVMLRNVISMMDHVLFSNRTVVLMGGTVIINGEIFRLDVPLKKELMKKQIRSGNVEIEYAVPARYSGRYDNKRHLDVKDMKRLTIPIPAGRREEVQEYVDAPLPMQQGRCKKK